MAQHIVLQHIEERQTIPWPKPKRTNNGCALYNIVCPCWFWPWYCLTFCDVFCITLYVLVSKTHRRTSDNTIAKTNKDKQCYTKHYKENNRLSNTNLIVSLVLTMLLSDVLRCVLHNIVCPCLFWLWYCLTFFDVFCITLFVLVGFGHGIV
jgi:magnesium-transporting ATPase (P-type)